MIFMLVSVALEAKDKQEISRQIASEYFPYTDRSRRSDVVKNVGIESTMTKILTNVTKINLLMKFLNAIHRQRLPHEHHA